MKTKQHKARLKHAAEVLGWKPEPVSVEGIADDHALSVDQPEWICVVIDGVDAKKIKPGDRVRVVKIAECGK